MMRRGSHSILKPALSTPSNESAAFVPMPPDVREQVVGLLAKILVLDYELFQGVTEPIVKTPPGFNRKLRLVKTGEKAG